MPDERTPRRTRKATGGNKARETRRTKLCANDLRKDYSEKIGEVATELSWFRERNKELSASILGPRLNRRIFDARKKTQGLIDTFVVYLVELCPINFGPEAEKALTEFTEKCQEYIPDSTVRRWLRLAIARERRRRGKGKNRTVAELSSQPPREVVARPRKSLLSPAELRAVLAPATLLAGEVAKALGYSSKKTIYRMVQGGALNRTEKWRIRKDEKLRGALVSIYGVDVVAQVLPQ